MRFDRLFFTVLAVPFDFLAIVVAGFVAWSLRFSDIVQTFRPVVFGIAFPEYLVSVFVAAGFTVGALAASGVYRFPHLDVGPFALSLRLFLATSATLAAIALAFFLRQELFDSRFLVLVGWILATLFLIAERGLFGLFERWLARRYGLGLRRALVIGSDAVTQRLVAALKRDPAWGFRVVVELPDPDVKRLERAAHDHSLDAILLADPNFPRERVVSVIDFANERHVSLLFVPNLFQALTANVSVGIVGDIPVVELKRTALDGWGRVFKRAMDIFVSSLAVVVFALPMLVIALAVKLDDSAGPIIYRNRRAGEKGRSFLTLKFRSMQWRYSTGSDAPDPEGALAYEYKLAQTQSVRKGPVWKIINDPRRTRAGRFLERSSLDELPQFFNVLRGEMSIVGPRPHMLEQVAKYEKEHKRVLAIKPGITGLAQISGRSDLDFDDEVRLDAYYLEHWSPWLDIKIMLKTPFAVLLRKHKS